MKEEKAKRGKRKDSIKIGIKRRRLKFKQNVSNLLSSHHSPHYLTTNEWLMTLSAFITSNHSSHPSQPHFLSASFLSSSNSFEKELKKDYDNQGWRWRRLCFLFCCFCEREEKTFLSVFFSCCLSLYFQDLALNFTHSQWMETLTMMMIMCLYKNLLV